MYKAERRRRQVPAVLPRVLSRQCDAKGPTEFSAHGPGFLLWWVPRATKVGHHATNAVLTLIPPPPSTPGFNLFAKHLADLKGIPFARPQKKPAASTSA